MNSFDVSFQTLFIPSHFLWESIPHFIDFLLSLQIQSIFGKSYSPPLLTKRGEEKWYIEGGGVKYILRNAESNLTWEVVLKNDISTFFTSYW